MVRRNWGICNHIKDYMDGLIGALDFLDVHGFRVICVSDIISIGLGGSTSQFGANIVFGSLAVIFGSNINRSQQQGRRDSGDQDYYMGIQRRGNGADKRSITNHSVSIGGINGGSGERSTLL